MKQWPWCAVSVPVAWFAQSVVVQCKRASSCFCVAMDTFGVDLFSSAVPDGALETKRSLTLGTLVAAVLRKLAVS